MLLPLKDVITDINDQDIEALQMITLLSHNFTLDPSENSFER